MLASAQSMIGMRLLSGAAAGSSTCTWCCGFAARPASMQLCNTRRTEACPPAGARRCKMPARWCSTRTSRA
eukprot:13026515-Alexandrium_andersonii.AAC.1